MPHSAQLLKEATDSFGDSSSTPRLDAEVLLSFVLEEPREHLLAHPEEEVGAKLARRFRKLATKRHQGKPIAHLTGQKEFYGLDFFVNEKVLCPRPETEKLIDLALQYAKNHQVKKVIDIGTGSGCIAISIAKNLPQTEVWASDTSRKALSIAKRNIQNLDAKNIKLKKASLLKGLPKDADLIVANLPYVDKQDSNKLLLVKFEPRKAIFAKEQGLAIYKKLLIQFAQYPNQKTPLLCEASIGQGQTMREFSKTQGLDLEISQQSKANGIEILKITQVS